MHPVPEVTCADIAQDNGGESWPLREPTLGEGAGLSLTSQLRQEQCPTTLTAPPELGRFNFLCSCGHEHLFICPTNSPVPTSGGDEGE